MNRTWLVALGVIAVGGCSSSTDSATVTFCMQWVNTSTRVVQFHAVDSSGDTLSTHTMMVPGIGDAFASPKLRLSGSQPITFSATNGFQPITIRPSGGSKVLIVEAHTVNALLEHYEDNGTCP